MLFAARDEETVILAMLGCMGIVVIAAIIAVVLRIVMGSVLLLLGLQSCGSGMNSS